MLKKAKCPKMMAAMGRMPFQKMLMAPKKMLAMARVLQFAISIGMCWSIFWKVFVECGFVSKGVASSCWMEGGGVFSVFGKAWD